MRNHPGQLRSFWSILALALIASVCLPMTASAVDTDKARYLGGTLDTYPLNARQVAFGDKAPRFEGRVDTSAAFTFDGGRWGTLSIPFEAISLVGYGWKLGPRPTFASVYGSFPLDAIPLHGPEGTHRIWFPWDPFEQFTDKVHYMLTIAYCDQAGQEQAVVFELGKALVRPTLHVLEQRTGKAIDFTDVSACMLYKTAKECGLGTPAELKGLRTVALDPGVAGDNRTRILAELEQAGLGLELLSDPERADMVLTFDSGRSIHPDCPCEGGRGEVSLVGDARRRVVFVFTGSKRGVWGKNPATGFGKAFAEAYMAANARTR